MYIVKSEKRPDKTIAQMELLDFFGTARKIVFNADDPKDAKKAERILKPKGLRKSRRPKRKQTPQKQKEMKEVIPNLAKKRVSNPILIQNSKLLESKPKLSKISSPPIKTAAIQPAQPINNEILKSASQKPISDQMITKFGDGGDLEVECPFCQEPILFEYSDIDEKDLVNTRLCICDAIARVSIRDYNRSIFNNLKIPELTLNKITKKHRNDVMDENNNSIYTYAFQNRI
jgi:hypothetical protein